MENHPYFDYDALVEQALRGVVREALTRAAEHGLPGDHHFYVTFRTDAEGVSIPPHLKAAHRITSYNVCYTKLLRHNWRCD